MKDSYTANLKCVFCDSEEFDFPYKYYIPDDNEMIKCCSCGRLNDFTSIKNYQVENMTQLVVADAENHIIKQLQKTGLKFTIK